jgi:hypothetical protein
MGRICLRFVKLKPCTLQILAAAGEERPRRACCSGHKSDLDMLRMFLADRIY